MNKTLAHISTGDVYVRYKSQFEAPMSAELVAPKRKGKQPSNTP